MTFPRWLRRWAALIAPDLAAQLGRKAGSAGATIAARLNAGGARANETVSDIMGALWSQSEPYPAWWHTPLGRACASSCSLTDTGSVTWAVAADMLGVTRGTVSQLMARGNLVRHDDGGIRRASVLERLAGQR